MKEKMVKMELEMRNITDSWSNDLLRSSLFFLNKGMQSKVLNKNPQCAQTCQEQSPMYSAATGCCEQS